MLETLHFIRPLWLLALIPLALLAWRAFAPHGGDNVWKNVVDARLMPLLQVGQAGKASRQALWLLAAGWLVATLALAGPTWERRPQPVFQTSAARVVVLDLSESMNAVDLRPSRLVRARYQVEDVLAQATEGQTGLVAYAGDAFTVSPLTRDANTVRSLLKVLEPSLMPTQGSRADLGLEKAGALLRQAGLSSGQVLLIADGVDPDHSGATDRAAARLRSEGYTVSVLGIGTDAGAPVVGAQGGLERDASGQVVVSRLDATSLRSVARSGGGEYRPLSDDGSALRALLAAAPSAEQAGPAKASAAASTWNERGPWLVLLLLPIAALAFRRNWLVGMALAGALAVSSQAADAATWTDAWKRPDQQAAQALAAGDYAKAAKAAAGSGDPSLAGSAAYKLGDYQHAVDDFSRSAGPEADYNRGNALARLGRLQEAVAAYDKSLAARPIDDDARTNKAAVEALLKQQQEQQKKQQQPGGAGEKKNSDAQQGQGKDKGSGKGQGKNQEAGPEKGPETGPEKGPEKGQGKGDDKERGQDQKQNAGSTAGAGQTGQSQASKEQPRSGQANPAPGSTPPGQTGADADARPATASASASASASAQDFSQATKKLGREDKAPAGADGSPTGPTADPTHAAHAAQAGHDPASRAASSQAQPLQSEERLAAEQWLRRIPDDPGGLLRRKFLYQYQQRQQSSTDAP